MAATPGPPELTLAERLRALRVDHRSGRVTQQTLASVLGVSTPLISSWESGAAVGTGRSSGRMSCVETHYAPGAGASS